MQIEYPEFLPFTDVIVLESNPFEPDDLFDEADDEALDAGGIDYTPDYFEYAVWPDGDTCPLEDVEEYMADLGKSDDYEVVGVWE